MDHCIFITIIKIIYHNIELKGREKCFIIGKWKINFSHRSVIRVDFGDQWFQRTVRASPPSAVADSLMSRHRSRSRRVPDEWPASAMMPLVIVIVLVRSGMSIGIVERPLIHRSRAALRLSIQDKLSARADITRIIVPQGEGGLSRVAIPSI